jgi:hypothetical protein
MRCTIYRPGAGRCLTRLYAGRYTPSQWADDTCLANGRTAYAARPLTSRCSSQGPSPVSPRLSRQPQPRMPTADSWLRAARRCVGDKVEQQQQQILPTLPMSYSTQLAGTAQ